MNYSITKEDLQSLQREYEADIINTEREVSVKRVRLQKLNALLDTYNAPGSDQHGVAGFPLASVETPGKLSDFEIVRRTILKAPETFTADEAFHVYCEAGKPGDLSRATFTTIVRKLAFGAKALLKSSSPGRGKPAAYSKGEGFGQWAKDFSVTG
jgi:hypothetical protein